MVQLLSICVVTLILFSCGEAPISNQSSDQTWSGEASAAIKASAVPPSTGSDVLSTSDILVAYNIATPNTHFRSNGHDPDGVDEIEIFAMGDFEHPQKQLFKKVKIRKIRVRDVRNRSKVLNHYRSAKGVLYAEEDLVATAADITPPPNDPYFPLQWGLHNTGQVISNKSGFPDADINAMTAWETLHDSAVMIAVLDSGIDRSHPDLLGNVNLVDGIRFQNGGTSSLFDDDMHSSHGTHVSGIIGAVGDNGVGVTGTTWSASILPIKFLNANGSGLVSDAAKGIDYAVSQGAKIINASYEYESDSALRTERIAIFNARVADVLVVAAAGNNGQDIYKLHSYPASHPVDDDPYRYNPFNPDPDSYGPLDNLISVAASTKEDSLFIESNFGIQSVHLAAPGEDIYSTTRGGYGYLSGTSMAAPFVSGAAALLMAQDPSLTPKEIIDRLVASVDLLPNLADKTISGGRLNIGRALSMTPATSSPPPTPEWLESDIAVTNRATLSWPQVNGSDGIKIERSYDGVTFQPVATVAGSSTGYTDTLIDEASMLTYRIRSFNALRFSPYVTAVPVQTYLTAPANVRSIYEDGQVAIYWHERSLFAERHVVEKRALPGGSFSHVFTHDDASAIDGIFDTAIQKGKSYEYRIRAENLSTGLISAWNSTAVFTGTASSSSNDCFLSNALAGSRFQSDLGTYRFVRDHFMGPLPFGNTLIRSYYSISPYLNALLPKNTIIRSGIATILHFFALILPSPVEAA